MIHGAPHIKAASVTPDEAVVILMVLQMPMVMLPIPAEINASIGPKRHRFQAIFCLNCLPCSHNA